MSTLDPAVMVNSHGGIIADFVNYFAGLAQTGQALFISGFFCASSCTLFAALPPEQVCVQESVTLFFHSPYSDDSEQRADPVAANFMMLVYPPPLRAWIKDKGGLHNNLLEMKYPETASYFRICGHGD